MIVDRKDRPPRPLEIDLSGPEGNVFVLTGYAKKLARRLDVKVEVSCDLLNELGVKNAPKNAGEYITNQMMESDYEHALEIFEKYFGNFVILYR